MADIAMLVADEAFEKRLQRGAPFAGAGEEATEEARARREAEKAELERKIASTKEELAALETALVEVDAAAGPEPAKP